MTLIFFFDPTLLVKVIQLYFGTSVLVVGFYIGKYPVSNSLELVSTKVVQTSNDLMQRNLVTYKLKKTSANQALINMGRHYLKRRQ